jgi:DNA-binding transcriptional MerR regulator
MPVATLRIWEQRYQAIKPSTAGSGHRLYATKDVERVVRLRRLTQQGHAIGLLAALDNEQLQALMQTLHLAKTANENDANDAPVPQAGLRIVVVGQALASRLKRLTKPQGVHAALQWMGVFDSLTEAAQAARGSTDKGVDLLLWQAGSLQPGAQHPLQMAQDALQARATAVVFRYASEAVRAELISAGTAVLNEPADDKVLAQWLASLQSAAAITSNANKVFVPAPHAALRLEDRIVSPPRFADTVLTEFAGLASTIACECPGHLAQLLLQISSFESYSGDCAHRSVADAALHLYLQRVAGEARMLFEAAIEHVAVAEGLPLPFSPATNAFFPAADKQQASAVSSIQGALI